MFLELKSFFKNDKLIIWLNSLVNSYTHFNIVRSCHIFKLSKYISYNYLTHILTNVSIKSLLDSVRLIDSLDLYIKFRDFLLNFTLGFIQEYWTNVFFNKDFVSLRKSFINLEWRSCQSWQQILVVIALNGIKEKLSCELSRIHHVVVRKELFSLLGEVFFKTDKNLIGIM